MSEVLLLYPQLPSYCILLHWTTFAVGLKDVEGTNTVKPFCSTTSRHSALLTQIMTYIVSSAVHDLYLQQTDQIAMGA